MDRAGLDRAAVDAARGLGHDRATWASGQDWGQSGRGWAAVERPKPAGRAGDGVVDELRPARAATTYRPRAWDGQRASRPSSPPSGAEVVPAGTADRGRRAERRRSWFPTSGAARESATRMWTETS